jgi:hypothetical protein
MSKKNNATLRNWPSRYLIKGLVEKVATSFIQDR